MALKPLDTFETEKKITDLQITYRVYRKTYRNGERLLLKYYSMKCFTFWENINSYQFSRITDSF